MKTSGRMRGSTARPWSVQEVYGVRSWGLFLLFLLLSSRCFRSETLLRCSFTSSSSSSVNKHPALRHCTLLLFLSILTACASLYQLVNAQPGPGPIRITSEHRRARARQTLTELAPAQWGQRRGLYRKRVVNKLWFKVHTRVSLKVKASVTEQPACRH